MKKLIKKDIYYIIIFIFVNQNRLQIMHETKKPLIFSIVLIVN